MSDYNRIKSWLMPRTSSRLCLAWRRLTPPARLRRLWSVAGALAICGLTVLPIVAAEKAQPTADPSKAAPPQEAALMVSSQPITVFRVPLAGQSPQERAAQATERILALPVGSESAEIKFEPMKIGAEQGVEFSANSRPLFVLMPGDLGPDSMQTLEAEAQTAVTALRAALQAHADQRQWSALLMSAARVLIAALVLLGLLWLWRRARIWLLRVLDTTAVLPEKYLRVFAVDLRMHILEVGRAAIHLVSVVVVLLLGYWWLIFSLKQFPYTGSLGETLEMFLVHLFSDFGRGAVAAIPGLVAVVIIVLIARWGVRLINAVFREVEKGRLSLPWMEKETARTTRTLLIVVVWLFALVVAYPYIPGSDTAAFKGLSVLIGLMVTLGSTGLINQIISGLFVIYSKSVKSGDYVRVGDVEGEVINVGSLATKLKTPKQEEITLPHSVLVATATTNYSRLAGEQGMVVAASVTIGYDVSWRQVHELLLLGASRTSGIRQEPAPRVLQRELSDFYVQYQILAHLEDGAGRAVVLSELYAQIQDAFNEYGVQIMSPHFESQPKKPVLVPKSAWYAAPASPPPSAAGAEPEEIAPEVIEPRESVSAEPAARPAPQAGPEKKDRKRSILRRPSRAKPPSI
ncbi:MAG TPA: mechanosensitive ion channel family protein [Candidatus Binatia bacterium]|nr:mechanosensitive ion channel family protein [Candidatus Binatia bacterium]